MTASHKPPEGSHSYSFRLAIPAEKYKAFYQGQVQTISVQSHDGKRIQFPASAVRQFLTAQGIYGVFDLVVDQHHKLIGLYRKS
ncbi:MAG: hypothetical protein PsegKO_28060 [Pseudohongiellaceae bacterium]|jgi:hypothetical protein